MRSPGLQKTALVLSPTPPLPRDYGNRNRVHQTISFLQSEGYRLSFLLYPFDDDWQRGVPDEYRQLHEMFDYFAVIPNSRRLHQPSAGEHHAVDEWWDETIAQHLRWLFERKRFDLLFVNYSYFSAAFDCAPPGTLKVLDTHDLLTGRKEMFARFGVAPEFFYTTADQERIAFQRADALIAIKAAEAEAIRTLTDKTVISLPYWDAALAKTASGVAARPTAFGPERPFRVGFIGARNSVNSVNMRRFLTRFERYVRLYEAPVEVVLAGNVCVDIPDIHPFVVKLGRVERIADFYGQIDAVVAPLEFSTGIKIKIGEALACGAPVVATRNAFDGFQPFHALQSEASVASLCDSLIAIATNEIALAPLAGAGRRAAKAAAHAQQRGFDELGVWLRKHTRRVVVVTGRPFWWRQTFVDEQIAQTVEFVSAIASTIVITTAAEAPQPSRIHARAVMQRCAEAEAQDRLREATAGCHVCGVILCDGAPAPEPGVVDDAALWRLEPAPGDDRHGGLARLRRREGNMGPALAPLRYLPLMAATRVTPDRVVLVLPEAPTDWEAAIAAGAQAACRARGLAVETLRAGRYWEYDKAFFTDVCRENAERWILIGDGAWNALIQQIARYRNARCLVLCPDLIAPVIFDAEGRPSLMKSLDAFLDGEVEAGRLAHADTGWGEMWARLSA